VAESLGLLPHWAEQMKKLKMLPASFLTLTLPLLKTLNNSRIAFKSYAITTFWEQ